MRISDEFSYVRLWPFFFCFRCSSDRWENDIVLDAGLALGRNHGRNNSGWYLHVAFILGSVWFGWNSRLVSMDAFGHCVSLGLIPRVFVEEGGFLYFFNPRETWLILTGVQLANRS